MDGWDTRKGEVYKKMRFRQKKGSETEVSKRDISTKEREREREREWTV